MHHQTTSVLFASLLAVLGCKGAGVSDSGSDVILPPLSASLSLIRFRTDSIAFALYSGVTVPQTAVIRDPAAWSALWQRIHANVDPMPPLPEVDFSQEMIVAAALGTRATGGYNVLLTQATEDSNGIQIHVLETSPGANCFNTQALTQPIDLGRVDRREVPVHFVVVQHDERCNP
jgi:hypothetical protein